MNYPLIKRWFPSLEMRNFFEYSTLTTLTVTAVSAADLERELEKAVGVTGFRSTVDDVWYFGQSDSNTVDTHTALLIGIEPFKKETAEDLLREMATAFENGRWADYASLVERAKALLERGEK